MPFTRGAREVPNQTPASNSDARKRIEGAMNALRDGLRDAVENMDTSKIEAFLAAGYEANHAPPPVEPAPWEEDERIGAWEAVAHHPAFKRCFSEDRPLLHSVLDRLSCLIELESAVTEMGPRTCPETQVPVERALIDEAARWVEWADDEDEAGVPRGARLTTAIVRDLAALADGAQS